MEHRRHLVAAKHCIGLRGKTIPWVFVTLLSLLASLAYGDSVDASDAKHPGKQVYDRHCAACHDDSENSQARPLSTLKRMIPDLIEYALTQGRMQVHGSQLSTAELGDLMAFFKGQTQADNNWVDQAMCTPALRVVDTQADATVSTFGLGLKNHRHLSAAEAGLDKSDFSELELAWAVGFPNITMMRSQPVIVGNTLFITPVDSRQLYAFDIASKPCVKWVYNSTTPLRTSLTYGHLPAAEQAVLVFGDMAGRLHMIDAQRGAKLWIKDLKLFPETIITGTPQLVDGVVYASISQFEIMVGAQPNHLCCRSHGAITALNATTGETLWLTHTLPDAQPVRDRGDGQMIWGPSGAPVWTSPAIDLKRQALYVGTGEATSEPAHQHTDAILALNLQDGSIKWSFQATANDIFLAACRGKNRSLNCPPEQSVERDVDFGASVIIAQRNSGEDILVAGQKSSDVWGLDPDTGKLVWHWNNGRGTANGGVHWGMAYDGRRVFVALADPGRPRPGFNPQPGLYALDVNTGATIWQHRTYPDCDERSSKLPYCEYLYGFSAATLSVAGAVVQGSLDGYLRVFDGQSGEVLFTYDTIREFAGINGVLGHGGAIDNASVVAANGMLFVSSGYGMFGQAPGNVLLAFRPKQDNPPKQAP